MIKQAIVCDRCGASLSADDVTYDPLMSATVCKQCRDEEVYEGWQSDLEDSDIRKIKDRFMIEKYD